MSDLRRMPVPSKLGAALMLFAGALDVAVHLLTKVHAGHSAAFGAEHVAHLLGIAGMFLVLAGVVFDGARRELRQRAARNGGFDGHAHR